MSEKMPTEESPLKVDDVEEAELRRQDELRRVDRAAEKAREQRKA